MKIQIRMYRVGLGDCFLLSFGTTKRVHVLVDCGVLLGTANADEHVPKCVEDIRKDTDGHLDVVIATHEHWDHVGGFAQAAKVFDKLTIGQIWFAWTEDPEDKLSEQLREDRKLRKEKLKAAVGLWQQHVKKGKIDDDPSLAATRIAMTEAVLAFGDPELLGAKATTADALGYLKKRKEPKEYLEPGTVRKLPGTDDVRVYVLGPPRDLKLLKKGRPSARNPETYSEEDAPSLADSFFAAVDTRLQSEERAVDTFTHPFDDFYRVPARTRWEIQQLQNPGEFYSEHYYAKDTWRQIDADWLGVTGDLALALDSDTNNTSLVLAFEIGEEGRVLLFPGDAQVGNWLSWKDMAFAVQRKDGSAQVTTQELLARTVFYKVGHHASHNATLRQFGLERMTNENLVAMIPVDRATAKKQGWDMPFGPLFERLQERCHGRVLLLDEDAPEPTRLRRLDTSDRATFAKHVKVDDLYVQLTFDT